jgi:hypothetical protein
MLVSVYMILAKGGKQPTCLEISTHVVELKGGEDPELQRTLTPRRAGDILRELGFRTTHTNRGSQVSIEPATLDGLCQRFDLDRDI